MAYTFETQENGKRDILVVRAVEQIQDKKWWFVLTIPEHYWEDLFGISGDDSMDAHIAYEEAPDFWNALAQEGAEACRRNLDLNSNDRHVPVPTPSYEYVEQRYRRFEADGAH